MNLLHLFLEKIILQEFSLRYLHDDIFLKNSKEFIA